MKIMAVDNDLTALSEMTKSLKAVFFQGKIEVLEYQDPMLAVQYLKDNPETVVLLLSAIRMQHIDGFRLADFVHRFSPGTVVFFTIQAECHELAWLAKQHGGMACLTKPVTAEKLRAATGKLPLFIQLTSAIPPY